MICLDTDINDRVVSKQVRVGCAVSQVTLLEVAPDVSTPMIVI